MKLIRQVASALEAAHASGVIHRDLKPSNLRVARDGTVKVLDFGLAKSIDERPAGEATDPASSPTLTSALSAPGVILGSAAYMSPWQARGTPVDPRTDLWAPGCLLCECLTGRRAFSVETISDALAAVLRAEPGWSALPAENPACVRRLLRRCLTKEPGWVLIWCPPEGQAAWGLPPTVARGWIDNANLVCSGIAAAID